MADQNSLPNAENFNFSEFTDFLIKSVKTSSKEERIMMAEAALATGAAGLAMFPNVPAPARLAAALASAGLSYRLIHDYLEFTDKLDVSLEEKKIITDRIIESSEKKSAFNSQDYDNTPVK